MSNGWHARQSAYMGNRTITKALCDAGANANAIDDLGFSVRWLCKHSDKRSVSMHVSMHTCIGMHSPSSSIDGYTFFWGVQVGRRHHVRHYSDISHHRFADSSPLNLFSSGRLLNLFVSGSERHNQEGTSFSSIFFTYAGMPALRKYFCAIISAAT